MMQLSPRPLRVNVTSDVYVPFIAKALMIGHSLRDSVNIRTSDCTKQTGIERKYIGCRQHWIFTLHDSMLVLGCDQ